MREEKELTNGGQVFMPITNKDVYFKLLDLEKQVTALKIQVYTVAGILATVGTIAGVLGGLMR